MPGDDDYHTPGGGLKLKGSKPSGIKKKKKKPSASTPSRDKELQKVAAGEESGASSSKQPEDNTDDIDLRDLEDRDPRDGKTAAERAAEETRRKRVRVFPLCTYPSLPMRIQPNTQE
jgi:protein FAM32A